MDRQRPEALTPYKIYCWCFRQSFASQPRQPLVTDHQVSREGWSRERGRWRRGRKKGIRTGKRRKIKRGGEKEGKEREKRSE